MLIRFLFFPGKWNDILMEKSTCYTRAVHFFFYLFSFLFSFFIYLFFFILFCFILFIYLFFGNLQHYLNSLSPDLFT